VLSGPAGGVVGYALTTYNEKTGQPVIGFDMGGERILQSCNAIFIIIIIILCTEWDSM